MKQKQTSHESPDGDLVLRMNNGEDGVFDTLYGRHRDWVHRMAFRLTGSPQMADDVLQDTFCYFLGKFPGFDLPCELRTFLYPVVRNLSLNILKKARRFEAGPKAEAHFERLEAPSPDPVESREILGITASLSADHLMRFGIACIVACMACPAPADIVAHRFDKSGGYKPAGRLDPPAKIIVLAEKPLRLDFPGHAADWRPAVHVQRITSARRTSISAPEADATADGWQWTWTPPKTRGPAQYEVQFVGEPRRIVRIETRDPAWLKATLEMLCNQADWDGQGLSTEERTALTGIGLQLVRATSGGKPAIASLQMWPRQGDAARRRVVWDEENTSLLVWRPGPANGDLEARAPRWWISPAALATDQGIIRLLDLFSELPSHP